MIPPSSQLKEEVDKIFNDNVKQESEIKTSEVSFKVLEKLYSELSLSETKCSNGKYYTLLGLVLCSALFYVFSSADNLKVKIQIIGIEFNADLIKEIVFSIPLLNCLLIYHFTTFHEKFYAIAVLKKSILSKICNSEPNSVFLDFVSPLPQPYQKQSIIDFLLKIFFSLFSIFIYFFISGGYYLYYCYSIKGSLDYQKTIGLSALIAAYFYAIYRIRVFFQIYFNQFTILKKITLAKK